MAHPIPPAAQSFFNMPDRQSTEESKIEPSMHVRPEFLTTPPDGKPLEKPMPNAAGFAAGSDGGHRLRNGKVFKC